ncbi:MAG: hypothetical protein ACM3PZ_02200 [Bacillota bacterium]
MIYQASYRGQKIVFHKENIFVEKKSIIIKSPRVCLEEDEKKIFNGFHQGVEICFGRENLYKEQEKIVVKYARNCDSTSDRPVPSTIAIKDILLPEAEKQLIREIMNQHMPLPERIPLDELNMHADALFSIKQYYKKQTEKRHRRRLAKA